ncbi:MAG TPA: YceI family protein, partial [Rhizomicrobium sp.]|nr:YceI family protein [Rhizomicrobium sp.]
KVLQVAAAFALLVSPSFALDTQNVPKGNYVLDPDHAQVIFTITHMGLSSFYGRLGKVTGTLAFDVAAPEQSTLDVQIDMTTIDTHVPKLDGELTDGMFNSAKFPTATFKATKIEKTGDHTGTVTGDLTIKDVTKPVTLNVTFNGGRDSPIPFQPYRIGFDATGTIKRSDFGLTNTVWSGFVSDDVTLAIEAELERQK